MRLRYYITLILLCLLVNGYGQKLIPQNSPKYDKKPLHFGFTLGLNTMDFTVRNTGDFLDPSITDTVHSVEAIPQAGFNIGIISNLRLMEYLDLRFLPGLNFGGRTMEYLVLEKGVYAKETMNIESIFLDFPVLLKYKSERLNNIRGYFIGGGTFRFDMASQKKVRKSEFDKPGVSDVRIRLHRGDVYYEVGYGTDFYLQYFKFSVELKFSVGLNNMVIYDNSQYTSVIERMNSKMIILSFHFE